MPSRKDVFVNGQVYHIYNKALKPYKPFNHDGMRMRFLDLLRYYRSTKSKLSFSKYSRLPFGDKMAYTQKINVSSCFKVKILAYCIMSNHYHILIKQVMDDGLVSYVSQIMNAVTKYHNILCEHDGPIFVPQFRSKRIFTAEQLLHVSRYIHLNPLTAGSVATLNKLKWNVYSSFYEYMNTSSICDTSIIMDFFAYEPKRYKEFVQSNVAYQKKLAEIKKRDNLKKGFR